MADKKTEVEKALVQLQPLAGALKTGVEAVWKAFVMKYVARGIGDVMVAGLVWYAFVSIMQLSGLWLLIPTVVSEAFLYDAIVCLFNPTYWAMMDAADKIKNLNKQEVEVVDRRRSY